jgi:ribosomal protein S12 methylthiotransferase
VRLHYVYPYPHVDALIPLMADGLVLPYLDVPLQHASPAILKAMRRPAAVENTLERIRGWRAMCPELTIRSTFIVGFPGETEADFEALLAFLDQAQLDRVGCFPYSPVAGAAANALPGAVPEAVKQERLARFMDKQAAISARRLQDKVGRTLEVLVDRIDDDGAIARTHADAPEIDGVVYLSDAEGVAVGDVLLVDVEDADAHDLYAVPSLV